jgi:hypothetical protein
MLGTQKDSILFYLLYMCHSEEWNQQFPVTSETVPVTMSGM